MSGGGSLGFQQASSRTKTRDLTPFEFANQRGLVASTLANQTRGNVPTIEGPFAAPLSAGELTGLNALQQNAFGPQGLGTTQDAFLQNLLAGGDQSPGLQAVIDAATRPIVQNAQLKELQDRAAFTGAGQKIQGSSAFAEDRLRSVRDTQQQIGDIAAQIAFQDFANRQAQKLQAVQLATARIADQRETIATLALPRLVEQFGLDKANEEFARRMQVIQESLLALGQLSSPTLGQFSRSSGFGAQHSAGGSEGGDSGGLSGAALAAG